jgi:hypothetical protein
MRKLKMKDLYVGLLIFKNGVPLKCLEPDNFVATFEIQTVDKKGNFVRTNEFVRLTEKDLTVDF